MVFEYSYWWIAPILFLSVGVAWFKFKKISTLPDIPRWLSILISTLRFAVVFILLFLLLKPALSFVRNVMERPLLIIAQDNSASLLNGKDSSYYKNEYGESLKKELSSLSDKYNVEWLTFSQNVQKNEQIDFIGNRTDIAGVFDYIDKNHLYQVPQAVVLLSDGIYNTGVNPRYKMLSYPVHTVGLGDTTEYPDVFIKSIEADKFNFIKTIFPVKVNLAAIKQKGKTVKCILKENGNTIGERSITIDHDNFATEIVFEAEAKQKGIVKYSVQLETGFAERSSENNNAMTFVNVIDNSGNIAIYYAAPHPDIAAINSVIEASGIYTSSTHSFNEPLKDQNITLFILHNPLPNNPNYRRIMELSEKKKIPVWYVLTTREAISAFARFGKAYSVNFGNNLNEYATIAYNGDFPFFEFTGQEIKAMSDYPPLIVPLGEIKSNAGRSLFTQKIKGTVTSNGIVNFYDNNDVRSCYFWGDGLWKWRLYSYRENGNHELFNLLINKIVGYLAAKKGNERFITNTRPLYDETEEVVIDAELYNDSYELVNTPDVKLVLKTNNQDFNYLLNRYGDKYRISLGNLQVGEYSYSFTTNLKGESFEKKGVFYVRSQNPEINDVVANKQLLKDIAINSGGKFIELSQLHSLVTSLNNDTSSRITYRSVAKHVELTEIGGLGILLLLLLCIEWFLLKYFVS